MQNIVGLKELRENLLKYANGVKSGHSFIIMRRSKPLFKITPVEDENWEEVIDFSKIKKSGIKLEDLLKRL